MCTLHFWREDRSYLSYQRVPYLWLEKRGRERGNNFFLTNFFFRLFTFWYWLSQKQDLSDWQFCWCWHDAKWAWTPKKSINVLGVTFDCKLQWGEHIAQAINKSKRSLYAIKLITKYLKKNEIKQIITSNFYSKLYYNCEIWLMPSLSPALKQQLLAASTRALKLLNNRSDLRISYDQQHKLQGRATPMEMMRYRLSIQLHKLYNGDQLNEDWVDLNYQQNFNNRQKFVQINDESALRIGKNILMNRLGILNNKIDYDWLNQSLNTFKIKSKKLFLTNNN